MEEGKHKKILFISRCFAPNNAIGAVRPTKQVKYLSQMGYEIDVVQYGYTGRDSYPEKVDARIFKMNNVPVPPVDETPNTAASQRRAFLRRKLGRLWVCLAKIKGIMVDMHQGLEFLKFAKNLYRQELCANKYDVLFTSYSPFGSLFCGFWFKKHLPNNVKWICDFRDPILQKRTVFLFKPLFWALQRSAFKKADKVITVSSGGLAIMNPPRRYLGKAVVIPNGYDECDILDFGDREPRDYIRMVYAGALYNGLRDLSPLFRAIRELIDEKVISSKSIGFSYAGSDYEVAAKMARKYSLESIVEDLGFMPREACLRLQYESDFLVLATWNKKGEEGILCGKFPIYMMMDRPIIALVAGDLPDSEVARIMRDGNLGIAYEEACDGQDFPVLKAYLKMQFENFLAGRPLACTPDQSVKNRFSYRTISKQLAGIIEEITKTEAGSVNKQD